MEKMIRCALVYHVVPEVEDQVIVVSAIPQRPFLGKSLHIGCGIRDVTLEGVVVGTKDQLVPSSLGVPVECFRSYVLERPRPRSGWRSV